MRARLLLPLAATLLAPCPAAARDYGQQGAVFAIAEPDLLGVIRTRLLRMQSTGAIDAANRALAARTIARVRRPTPIAGIGVATAPRNWLVDPTITVESDLRDAQGRVIIAAGQRVNPLDTVTLRQRLVFLDGDDPAQLAWAGSDPAATGAKLILVRGAPLELMKTRQRRFYFDQGGTLSRRLGIRAVPAMVEQRGRLLAAREVVLARSGRAR